MGRTTLDTAALAQDLRLPLMRFSRRLRNQRITRTPHPTDRRQVIIGLTPAAEEMLAVEAAGIMDELASG